MQQPLWNGTYASFQEVPAQGNAYDGEEWSRSIRDRVQRWHEAVRAAQPLAPVPERGTALAAVLAGWGQHSCSVLDIGGGGATAYLHAREALPGMQLEWTVVERPAVCEAARTVVSAPGLAFSPTMPERAHDLAFMGSSLQYFDDWRATLAAAARFARRFVLLEDVPAIRGATFAAAQAYYGGTIPAWFIRHDDLMAHARSCGLQCVLRDRFRARILGQWDGFPMDNYPPEQRVGLASTFLFRVGA